jgi:hypothetical protein
MPEFVQEQPRLGNQYDEDPLLRSYLRWRLPAKMLVEVEPGLHRLGFRAATDILALGEEAEASPPRHVPYDAWGRRVDRIETSDAWQELDRISAVEGIVANDDDTDLTTFIEAANSLVTDCCGTAGYTDTKLELIERWLSAHFFCVFSPRAIEEQASSVRERFENKVDLGLDLTRYGQQAKRLDTAGGLALADRLAKEGKRAFVAGMSWLGHKEDEAISDNTWNEDGTSGE